jgi:hypothetical protein
VSKVSLDTLLDRVKTRTQCNSLLYLGFLEPLAV